MTPQLRGAERGILNFFYQRRVRAKPETEFTLAELTERFCIANEKTKYPMSRDALQIALGNMLRNSLLDRTGVYYYLTAEGLKYAADSYANHIAKQAGQATSR